MFGKMNGYFEDKDRNKYLTLVSTNENKWKIKKIYQPLELNQRIRSGIRSITKSSN